MSASVSLLEWSLLDAETFTVIGIVKDLKYVTVQDHQVPFAYVLMSPADRRQAVSFVARSRTPAGIRGNVAYTVARRRRDLGIRIALGAARGRVVLLVLSECAVAVSIGAVIGLVGVAIGGTLARHFLYGVAPTDWVSLGSAILTVGLVAGLAVLVPVTRAVRTDPVNALRSAV